MCFQLTVFPQLLFLIYPVKLIYRIISNRMPGHSIFQSPSKGAFY